MLLSVKFATATAIGLAPSSSLTTALQHNVRRRPDGTKELLHTLAEGHIPDGFKLDTEGNLWITAFGAGGLDVLSPTGEHLDFLETGGVPLNCAFDGTSIYVCDFGTTDTSSGTAMNGRLIRVDDVGATGMPLFRGAIS